MRTLSDALTQAQQGKSLDPIWKIVLSLGSDEYTYTHDRILSLTRTTSDYSDVADILLDNSPDFGGDLTDLDLTGFEGVISKGLVLPDNSEEYSATAPLFVIPQQLSSQESGNYCRLSLIGIFNLMSADEASEDYEPTDADTNTIKDHLDAIIGATLDCFNHCKAYTVTYDSEDAVIDSFIPADFFSIAKGSSRTTAIQKLLGWTGCVARIESDGEIHISKPTISGNTWVADTAYVVNDYVQPSTPNNSFTYRCTTAGTSHATTEPTWPTTAGGTVSDGTVVWTAVGFDYEYELTEEARATHTFFQKNLRKRLVVPNKITVVSHPSHSPIYTGSATISGYASLDTNVQKTHFAPYLRLTSNAQATAIAEAMLAKQIMGAERGSGSVPMNVGAELYDYVKITDAREDDFVIGNIGYIKETCKPDNDASKGFSMQFGFGKLMEINALGLLPADPALMGGAASISALLDGYRELGNNLALAWDAINQTINVMSYITTDGLVVLDKVEDGTTYGKVLQTQLSMGSLYLSAASFFAANYDPTEKEVIVHRGTSAPADTSKLWFDTTVGLMKAYSGGAWKVLEGEWYNKTGVAIDATKGIGLYGGQISLKTYPTLANYEADTNVQCYVGTDGKIYAGGGSVFLDVNGITIKGEQLYFQAPNATPLARFLPVGTTLLQLNAYTGVALQIISPLGVNFDGGYVSITSGAVKDVDIYSGADILLDATGGFSLRAGGTAPTTPGVGDIHIDADDLCMIRAGLAENGNLTLTAGIDGSYLGTIIIRAYGSSPNNMSTITLNGDQDIEIAPQGLDVIPGNTGVDDLGTGTDYWDQVCYKTLSDEGCPAPAFNNPLDLISNMRTSKRTITLEDVEKEAMGKRTKMRVEKAGGTLDGEEWDKSTFPEEVLNIPTPEDREKGWNVYQRRLKEYESGERSKKPKFVEPRVGVVTNELVWLLLKGIQELTDRVKQLEAK